MGDHSKIQDICVGEGLPLIPPKLVERIERGDYIEMFELIAEFGMVCEEEEILA